MNNTRTSNPRAALFGAFAALSGNSFDVDPLASIPVRTLGSRRAWRSKYTPHVGIKQQRKADALRNRKLNAA